MMLSSTVRKSLLPALGWPSGRRGAPLCQGDRDQGDRDQGDRDQGDRDQGDRAATLAAAVAQMRQHMIAEGVRPLPGGIARAFHGYFPEALLRKGRFAVAAVGPLRVLPRLLYGHAAATTLVDVIAFGSDHAAQADVRLWAHNLTHVMQFQRWGTEEFARRYVRDRAAIEQEAAANAARFMAWRKDAAAAE